MVSIVVDKLQDQLIGAAGNPNRRLPRDGVTTDVGQRLSRYMHCLVEYCRADHDLTMCDHMRFDTVQFGKPLCHLLERRQEHLSTWTTLRGLSQASDIAPEIGDAVFRHSYQLVHLSTDSIAIG